MSSRKASFLGALAGSLCALEGGKEREEGTETKGR